jgi:hypothetical protein
VYFAKGEQTLEIAKSHDRSLVDGRVSVGGNSAPKTNGRELAMTCKTILVHCDASRCSASPRLIRT